MAQPTWSSRGIILVCLFAIEEVRVGRWLIQIAVYFTLIETSKRVRV